MTKNIAKSIKIKLLNLAKKELVDYQQLVIRYLYERLLYRLSISDYNRKFYLKGGTLLYAFEEELSRPTKDIDFLCVKIKNDMEQIKDIFIEICALPCKEDGVNFDTGTITTETITEGRVYAGINISLVAYLDTIRQVLNIDIGFGDIVVPKPLVISYPALMKELPTATILAYSLESVVAEKFQAMIELSEVNSRFKDFYDVYKILKNHKFSDEILSTAIQTTFHHRNTANIKSHPLFSKEFAIDEKKNKQWMRFLKKIKQDDSLTFETVMSLIVTKLKPIYDTIF